MQAYIKMNIVIIGVGKATIIITNIKDDDDENNRDAFSHRGRPLQTYLFLQNCESSYNTSFTYNHIIYPFFIIAAF